MPFLSPNQQCQSTEGKISHSVDLLTPSSPGVFQLCIWRLIVPGNLGKGCHMPLISPLMPVPPLLFCLIITIHCNLSCVWQLDKYMEMMMKMIKVYTIHWVTYRKVHCDRQKLLGCFLCATRYTEEDGAKASPGLRAGVGRNATMSVVRIAKTQSLKPPLPSLTLTMRQPARCTSNARYANTTVVIFLPNLVVYLAIPSLPSYPLPLPSPSLPSSTPLPSLIPPHPF